MISPQNASSASELCNEELGGLRVVFINDVWTQLVSLFLLRKMCFSIPFFLSFFRLLRRSGCNRRCTWRPISSHSVRVPWTHSNEWYLGWVGRANSRSDSWKRVRHSWCARHPYHPNDIFRSKTLRTTTTIITTHNIKYGWWQKYN